MRMWQHLPPRGGSLKNLAAFTLLIPWWGLVEINPPLVSDSVEGKLFDSLGNE